MGPLTRSTVLGLLFLLSSCGFHPIYAPDGAGLSNGASDQLAAIDVGLIPDRSGQILRQDVQARLERFGVGAAKEYNLSIAFSVSQDSIGIQPDTSSTFTRVQASANWTLRRLDPQATLVTAGTAHAVDGYNVVDLQVFASELESESVQRKLSERIADQIMLQLGIFFKRQPGQTPT